MKDEEVPQREITLDFQMPRVPEYAQAQTKSQGSLLLAQPAESEQTRVLPLHSSLLSAQLTVVAEKNRNEYLLVFPTLDILFINNEFRKSIENKSNFSLRM